MSLKIASARAAILGSLVRRRSWQGPGPGMGLAAAIMDSAKYSSTQVPA